MCARIGWIFALSLSVACFEPIIKDPGATSGEGSSSSGDATSSGESSSSSASGSTSAASSSSTSASSSGGSASDGDVMGSTTTGEEGPSPFFCEPMALCGEAWKVEPCEGCDTLTSLGECFLSAQAKREVGFLEVIRCDPECRIERIALRGGDTADAIREVATLDGQGAVVSVAPPERCTLQEVAYFEGCLAGYTPACADSQAWLVACEPYGLGECPIH